VIKVVAWPLPLQDFIYEAHDISILAVQFPYAQKRRIKLHAISLA
jgi:hypothetical protein